MPASVKKTARTFNRLICFGEMDGGLLSAISTFGSEITAFAFALRLDYDVILSNFNNKIA